MIRSCKTFFGKEYKSSQNDVKIYYFSGLLISLFLVLFQPFGIVNFSHSWKTLFLIGYGFLTSLCLVINLKIFKHLYVKSTWTILHQVKLTISAFLMIGTVLFFYSLWGGIFSSFGIEIFFSFLLKTLSISIFPILITAFRFNEFNKKDIPVKPDRPPQAIRVYAADKSRFLDIIEEDLIVVESLGNYVTIYHRYEHSIKKEKLRSTLKWIEKQLNNQSIFIKVHRAYIINKAFVKGWEGNSHKLKLVMNHMEKPIPVSRSLAKDFILNFPKLS